MCVRCAWHCFDSFAFLGSLSQALYVHTEREGEREIQNEREGQTRYFVQQFS